MKTTLASQPVKMHNYKNVVLDLDTLKRERVGEKRKIGGFLSTKVERGGITEACGGERWVKVVI